MNERVRPPASRLASKTVTATGRSESEAASFTAAASPLVPAPIMATRYGLDNITKFMKKHTTKVSPKRFLDLLDGKPTTKTPSFYKKVYAIVRNIPKGKVTTYGAIAETIGMKSSSRLVGQALRSMPPDSDIPAQRVINRAGLLTGAH